MIPAIIRKAKTKQAFIKDHSQNIVYLSVATQRMQKNTSNLWITTRRT